MPGFDWIYKLNKFSLSSSVQLTYIQMVSALTGYRASPPETKDETGRVNFCLWLHEKDFLTRFNPATLEHISFRSFSSYFNIFNTDSTAPYGSHWLGITLTVLYLITFHKKKRSTINLNLFIVDKEIRSTCWIFRKGGCVNVDCLNSHALFAPKAKPLKSTEPNERREIDIGIYLLWTLEKVSGLIAFLLALLLGHKVANIKIDQSLKLLPVCALSSSFQVFFRSKASQVPALVVRCCYVLHLFTLSLTGSLINRGGGRLIV